MLSNAEMRSEIIGHLLRSCLFSALASLMGWYTGYNFLWGVLLVAAAMLLFVAWYGHGMLRDFQRKRLDIIHVLIDSDDKKRIAMLKKDILSHGNFENMSDSVVLSTCLACWHKYIQQLNSSEQYKPEEDFETDDEDGIEGEEWKR